MGKTLVLEPAWQDGQFSQLQMLKAELDAGDADSIEALARGGIQKGQGPGSFSVFGKALKSGVEAYSVNDIQMIEAAPMKQQGFTAESVGRYGAMSVEDDADLLAGDFGIAGVVPKPTPKAPETDAPEQKAISPDELVKETEDYLSLPQVTRKDVTSADGTDALIFAAMFLFIDFQRQEVAAMMDTVKYNNDMARQIEQYKAAVNAAADRARAMEGKDPKVKLDDQSIIDYIWSQNLVINGVPARTLFPNVQDMRNKEWTAAELTQMATALDIKRTEFTDMNSQYMQKLQMALGLLQVFQQMLTSLIDTWKRVKEGIASKL